MESSFANMTIEEYNSQIGKLYLRKIELVKSQQRLIKLKKKLDSLITERITDIFLKRTLELTEKLIDKIDETIDNLSSVRDATIFYTKYDPKNNGELFRKYELLNQQALVCPKREALAKGTKVYYRNGRCIYLLK